MKFIKSNMDYLKNEIIIYYKKKDNSIIKKKYKFNKLMPYVNKKKNNNINIIPYNFNSNNYKIYNKNDSNKEYDLNTKYDLLDNYIGYNYKKLYETESELYNNTYKKKFKYDIQFEEF